MTTDDPDGSPKQGGGPTGESGPRAGAPRPGCAKADRELAVALAGELPAALHGDPVPVGGRCPDGTRAAAFRITGAHPGTVAVLLLPAGAPGLPELPGADVASVPTGDGGSLVVRSRPAVPLHIQPVSAVHRIATALAPRF